VDSDEELPGQIQVDLKELWDKPMYNSFGHGVSAALLSDMGEV